MESLPEVVEVTLREKDNQKYYFVFTQLSQLRFINKALINEA